MAAREVASRWQCGLRGRIRQNLEPLNPPATPDLDPAMRDALAVYYFPGMWDRDRRVQLPLVVQELERALARQQEALAARRPYSIVGRPWARTIRMLRCSKLLSGSAGLERGQDANMLSFCFLHV